MLGYEQRFRWYSSWRTILEHLKRQAFWCLKIGTANAGIFNLNEIKKFLDQLYGAWERESNNSCWVGSFVASNKNTIQVPVPIQLVANDLERIPRMQRIADTKTLTMQTLHRCHPGSVLGPRRWSHQCANILGTCTFEYSNESSDVHQQQRRSKFRTLTMRILWA